MNQLEALPTKKVQYEKYLFSPVLPLNPFMPTVPTFAVRETDVSRHNGGTSGAPLKPLRDDSALKVLSSRHPIMPRDVSLSDSKCWNGGQKLVTKTQRWARMG